jgi:hypothetical protein
MAVLKLNDGLGLTECCHDVVGHIIEKKQRTPATRQGIMKILSAMKLL